MPVGGFPGPVRDLASLGRHTVDPKAEAYLPSRPVRQHDGHDRASITVGSWYRTSTYYPATTMIDLPSSHDHDATLLLVHLVATLYNRPGARNGGFGKFPELVYVAILAESSGGQPSCHRARRDQSRARNLLSNDSIHDR